MYDSKNNKIENIPSSSKRHKDEGSVSNTTYILKDNFDFIQVSNNFGKGIFIPLFKEVKTNIETWERYTTSYMKLWYVIYAKDLNSWELVKIIPWGSYGRFNAIEAWTFEDLKNKAKTKYKEETEEQEESFDQSSGSYDF